jgi:hydrogenase-4 component H
MKYPKLRELKEAVTALIRGPVTTTFPATPHTAFPKFRGKPVGDEKECIACGACAEVCPARAIEIKDMLDTDQPSRAVIWHYDICIFCGQCERFCTTQKGVTLSTEYDLATFDRSSIFCEVKKELAVCEDCGQVIAPRAQLAWIARRLGPLASGNFNLIYTEQKELQVADDISSGLPAGDLNRQDLYRILCPQCRHLVLVFNQTGKQP